MKYLDNQHVTACGRTHWQGGIWGLHQHYVRVEPLLMQGYEYLASSSEDARAIARRIRHAIAEARICGRPIPCTLEGAARALDSVVPITSVSIRKIGQLGCKAAQATK